MTMEVRMDGRIALITGASKGLGKAMAIEFARSGASIALVARTPETLAVARKEVEAAGGKAIAYPCDVSKASEIEATWNKAVGDFGRIDILVNNAGASATSKFED